jgi:hypothetical protein
MRWPKALSESRFAVAILLVLANVGVLELISRLPAPQPQFGDYHARLVGYLALADFVLSVGFLIGRQWLIAIPALGCAAFLFWTLLTY